MKSILVIEDDVSILRGLADSLVFEGYDVTQSDNGSEGYKKAIEGNPDLLLLDIMLPGMSGYEVCRKLKQQKPEISIIMISARGEEVDKVSGLDIGADDYVTKPFSIPELMARIRAVFRRIETKTPGLNVCKFGNVIIDFKKYITLVNDTEVSLSSKEYDILEFLIRNKGEVIHRHQLLEEVWGYEVLPTTRTVDNFILDIRKKIEAVPSDPKYILSVRGVGYKFAGEEM